MGVTDRATADLAALYERLLLPRVVEEKMLKLLTQGRLSKWFSGIGQEAVAVGAASALRPDDWLLPLHRNLGVFTTRSRDLPRLFRQLLGRADGHTQGRDRSFHFGDLDDRIVGMISHLGAMLPVACGLALAARLRGEDGVALVFCGDGTASEGDVHEAMNLAAVWRLPVVFLIENNAWGLSTPAREQYACATLADRAIGYGMPGEVIDGNDVLAVIDAVGRAAERGRAGEGPTLVEALTFRMRGHEEASGTAYVPPELLAEWAGRDPITRFEAVLDAGGGTDAAARSTLRDRLRGDVDRLVADALTAPVPESSEAAELAAVHGPRRRLPGRRSPVTPHRERRYVDAIGDALRVAMRADDRVVLLGQDIAGYGGAFKVTDGFLAEFGADRVRNTPIIESGAIGAALGLALDGFLPVVELQFGDFVACGFNQVVNNLAKTHYRWGAPVPVVLRLPIGGGTGAGPFHSQDVEAWFCHVAGLKVVAPSTPADAKALLLAALEDGNPVLYCEHKAMYRSVTGPVAEDDRPIEVLGPARVVRPGRDATVVTWSIGVPWALTAAEALSGEGIEVEVVDLRTLLPWDVDTVLASVERTGRCLVLHEAPITGGFGGEVAATVADRAFAHLDAPVRRLGALDTPVPHAKALEALHSPRDRLLPTLRALLAY